MTRTASAVFAATLAVTALAAAAPALAGSIEDAKGNYKFGTMAVVAYGVGCTVGGYNTLYEVVASEMASDGVSSITMTFPQLHLRVNDNEAIVGGGADIVIDPTNRTTAKLTFLQGSLKFDNLTEKYVLADRLSLDLKAMKIKKKDGILNIEFKTSFVAYLDHSCRLTFNGTYR